MNLVLRLSWLAHAWLLWACIGRCRLSRSC